MNTHLTRVVLTVVLLFIAVRGAFGQNLQDDVLDIDQLRALSANRMFQIDSLRVAYEVFQDPAADNPNGHIPYMYRNVLVDMTTGRFSMERSLEIEGIGMDGELKNVSLAFDGEVQGALLPDKKLGIVQESALYDGLTESGLWGVMLLGQPQPDGVGIDDRSMVSFLAHGTVRDHLELVTDRPCHVVDAYVEGGRYATIWLDVERDLLPMKRVGYGRNGNANSELTVDTVAFLEKERIWLPESWHGEIHVRGETLRTYTHLHPESVEFNPPVHDEDFRQEFPPGTIVADQIAGLTYRVTDTGGIGEIFYKRVNGEWVTVSDSTEPEDEDTEQHAVSAQPPVLEDLMELMSYAARLTSTTRSEHTDAAENTRPPTASNPTEEDSTRSAQSQPTATAPSIVEPLESRRTQKPPRSAQSSVAPAVAQQPSVVSRFRIIMAIALAALLGIGCFAWRRCANARQRGLLVAALLVVAFALWHGGLTVPAAEPGLVAVEPARVPALGPPAIEDVYALADDELIRCIPTPDPEARGELLERFRLRQQPDIVSITVAWNGSPRFNGMQVGTGQFPRNLLSVLESSLKVPLYRLDGLDVARKIALPGDWVIRDGADLDQCMAYVEKVVRLSGYENFRIAREKRNCPGFEMIGAARAPDRPIRILPPHPDVSPVPPRTGTLRRFGEALGAAIQRPLSNRAEPQDLKITWEDNSRAYIDVGTPVSDQMISDLLGEISAALGVTFAATEAEETVWRLERAK
jgi:hypothetical protein